MFLDIVKQINSDLKTQFSWLKDARRYKGEFEGGTDWKPAFPIVLTEFTANDPLALAGGKGVEFSNQLNIWVADKDLKESSVLDRAEDIVDFLSDHILKISGPLVLYPVTLTSPADGSTTVVYDNADLLWQSITGMTYNLQVATDSGFTALVFDQDRIKYVNFTLPNGILSPGVQYYWRVRAFDGFKFGDWSDVRSFTTVSSLYGAEALALFPRMPNQPNATRKGLIDTFIKGLITDGVWSIWDQLILFAAHTDNSYEALLNYVKDANNASLIGSPAFVVDRGFTTSINNYISLNFNPTLHGINYTLNNAGIYVYSETNSQSANPDAGFYGTGYSMLYPRYTNDNMYGSINGSGNSNVANASSAGLSGVQREDSTHIQLFKNGASLGTFSNPSASMPNAVFTVGNVQGGFTGHQIAAIAIGAKMTPTQEANFYNRLQTFLTAIGAGV